MKAGWDAVAVEPKCITKLGVWVITTMHEPELIWTFPYQDVPTKFVVRTDANWTGQDNEDQKCFNCVVVRFGEHVIDVVWFSLSAPESEFYVMTIGGAHGIHTKNIFSDLQAEVTVRFGDRFYMRIRHLSTPWCWPTETSLQFLQGMPHLFLRLSTSLLLCWHLSWENTSPDPTVYAAPAPMVEFIAPAPVASFARCLQLLPHQLLSWNTFLQIQRCMWHQLLWWNTFLQIYRVCCC